jgi:ferredoxin
VRNIFIKKDLCNGCGKCVAECHKAAIEKDSDGNYIIDPERCNDCKDIFDVECIRICGVNAIRQNDGSLSEFDPTWRFRSEHLIWLMAVMGSRGNNAFPANEHWEPFRKIIAAAYLDPELKVRMTRNFDDNCIGCHRKQDLDHVYK